ncbi:MAG: virulence RhuM family protein [Candidatus Eremiobacteraeota bacterium]|nr:virulence RhuM family protein [Candidatus Eremiobacteraeota bacterium]
MQNQTKFLMYVADNGNTHIQVQLLDDTVWLSQRLIAELFQKSVPTINEHIKTLYSDGELLPEATIRKFRIVQIEGGREVERLIDYYNLDMILAVGYRVRSNRGIQFRRWATDRLKEYIIKGFVLDDERLKSGRNLGRDYFDELLERIRDIRSSERRFYQKITDIYAKCSIDYAFSADISKKFFATVQNKLHWAIHGHTAAELIKERADAEKPNIGLTTWKNAPGGPIRKYDVTVAKNYLTEEELKDLNLIVSQYLDYAEFQAKRRVSMTMKDWKEKLDSFLKFNECEVLDNPGKVSAEVAKFLAHREFDKHLKKRQIVEASNPSSDFDIVIQKVKQLCDRNND